MEDLVSVINKLQEVTALLGEDILNLPQIVVVGDQSSGKSSVLESLVGQPFLPRGVGVVTRRPLILQLVRKTGEDGDNDDWDRGIFLHDNERVYTDFNDIRDEIVAETIRKAGPDKDINPDPIILKIFSNKVSTLTMVDLPGIVKVPVGDQPPDVEQLVKALILKYISNANSIILAIVTANTDMATCESLKIAKEVDPNFERTIAVVTKLDLMDAGTDATDILTGNVIPVKLGIVGVVNRSQLHTVEGKRISDAIKDEANYLRTVYPSIAYKHGIPSLARTLHRILLERIENCLPQLRQRIKASISHYERLYSDFGSPIDEEDPKKLLLEILTKYSNTYCNRITGTHIELETKELTGGARITYIFQETYGKTLEGVDPLDGLSRAAIVTAIRNTTGLKPTFFIPGACFELLVKKQIERLESPSLTCVQLIHDELERIITDVGPQLTATMLRFPALHKKIRSITTDLIKARVSETNDMVRNLVRIHCSYINMAHPDFVRDKIVLLAELKNCSGEHCKEMERKVVPELTEATESSESPALRMIEQAPKITKKTLEDNPPGECLLVERLIVSYFNVVRRSIQDTVPKAIMHFLVNHVMDRLPSHLVSQLYCKEATRTLFEESQSVAEQRSKILALLDTYRRADKVINELKGSF
ncbi:dynamin 1-like protein [Nesidiocoris tenuis]|uniref:Dynamin 1-like protein n=1 Tax=Nesidiocoris tenuis TaxID=355587 RepID=A0ABN7AU73_9HEMI|nr:dynamin 1-like protein [Nesidiocoris tenuis]